MANHRINSIDIVRMVAATLVIAIHTQAIMWFSDRANGNIQNTDPRSCPIFLLHQWIFSSKRLCSEGLLRYCDIHLESV